ncbi:MAG: YezD family protein [Polycyclovorans sp.]|jgi:hypothetical protein|nr:hypothetical protein [Polycyclovorans sp.]MBU0789407.1 YezD family protein [Gammaproteobacteria bacterium]MDP1542036.1 YezD family protein [Polycyclovorans sp.]MEC8849526.1 YezD family protein [Pseudomonadota bacterium]|tara:strand:- start:26241 stop:26411 length:171 start_codon:yes stop_codon:yes gene_type:complete
MSEPTPSADHASALTPALNAQLSAALAGLRFGSVEITVHDGRIVQIERREKVRLNG